jgi:putative transcriptional regulator
VLGVEEHRAGQGCLEDAVTELSQQADREQAAEVGSAQRNPDTAAVMHPTTVAAGRCKTLGRTGQDVFVAVDLPAPAPWTGCPPARGRLLLATPVLSEPTFHRTVIYLLEHDEDGSAGVILNRPSRTPVGHVLPDWADVVARPPLVFGGGPVVPDGALCLGELAARAVDPATAEQPGIRPVVESLGTVDLDADVALITGLTNRLRVFAGHAGWAGGQLADELAEGAWYVVESEPDDVFTMTPGSLWRRVLRRQPPPLNLMSTYPPEIGLN